MVSIVYALLFSLCGVEGDMLSSISCVGIVVGASVMVVGLVSVCMLAVNSTTTSVCSGCCNCSICVVSDVLLAGAFESESREPKSRRNMGIHIRTAAAIMVRCNFDSCFSTLSSLSTLICT